MKMILCLASVLALISCSTNSSGGGGTAAPTPGTQPGQQTPQAGGQTQPAAGNAGACFADNLALQEQPNEMFDMCKELSGPQVNAEVVQQTCQNSEPQGAYKPVASCPQAPLASCTFNEQNGIRLKLYFYKSATLREKFFAYCQQQGGTPQ